MSAWTVWQCLCTHLMKTPHLLSMYYARLVWNSMLGHVWLNFTIWWNGRMICKLSFWCAHPGMPNVVGPEWWLWCIGYQWSYGDQCGGNALPGGDSNTQYMPYCGNQHPVRLLIVVLFYFLQVQHHKYAAAVMVLSQKYSSTYSLTLMHLSYAANLSGAMIWHAPMHMALKMHITKISELKLWSNELSGGSDAYSIAWGKSQLGTLWCGRLGSQRLSDWLGQSGLFYREVWRYCNTHACGHKDVTTCRHGVWDYSHGQWVPNGCLPHTLGREAHCISLLDQYGNPTKCKKIRSCDTCI